MSTIAPTPNPAHAKSRDILRKTVAVLAFLGLVLTSFGIWKQRAEIAHRLSQSDSHFNELPGW